MSDRDTEIDVRSRKDLSGIFVTNFNPRFTGVSATAAGVVAAQRISLDVSLVGEPLPGCPEPISLSKAYWKTRMTGRGGPVVWHVRRNAEMLAAVFGRDILRLPMKIVFTSAAQRLHSWTPRQLIARMDAVIATSEAAEKFVPNVWSVIPHGVDIVQFHPSRSRGSDWAALGFPGERGVATVGRIRPEKGIDLFVSAMILALPNLPGTTALVVGRATAEHAAFAENLKRQVADAKLQDRILFIGELAPQKMPDLFRSLSLLVAVPRYEGYGMTALEAMASGVPVLASNTGHFAEFCAAGGGVILESNEPATISRQVVRLMGDENACETLGQMGRKAAEKHYSVVFEADAISRVYSALLSDSA